MTLGYIAAFDDSLALAVIVSKGIAPLKDALINEPEDHIIEWNQNMFFELRGALVKNLAYQFRMGRVEWPKTFSTDDKGTWTPDRIMERTAKR